MSRGFALGSGSFDPPIPRLLPTDLQMDGDYFPLTFGMSWQYRVEIRLPETTLIGGMVLAVESEPYRIGEQEYVRSTETPIGFDQAEVVTHYARRAADGIYEIHPEFEHSEEYRLMPLPLFDGARWSVDSPAGDSLTCTAQFVGEVEVLGKKYLDCVELVLEGKRALGGQVFEARVTEVRAPSTGMVRASTETASFAIHLSLESISGRSGADS